MSDIIVLNEDNPIIQYLIKKDKRLAKVISMVGTISYQKHEDEYAFLIHEIIEQMLSVKAGAKIYERLKNICSGEVTPERVAQLSINQIKDIGTSNAKASYIQGVTDAVISGELDFRNLSEKNDVEVAKELLKLRGVGAWTVKMYLMFVLDRPDVLPFEDVAFLQAYSWMYNTSDRSKSAVEKKCKKWKPYSSYAARYLYRALDMGYTKTRFQL